MEAEQWFPREVAFDGSRVPVPKIMDGAHCRRDGGSARSSATDQGGQGDGVTGTLTWTVLMAWIADVGGKGG